MGKKIDKKQLAHLCELVRDNTDALAEAFGDLGKMAGEKTISIESLRYQWAEIQRHVGHVDSKLQAIEIVLHPGMLDVGAIPQVDQEAIDASPMVVPPFDDDKSLRDDLGALSSDEKAVSDMNMSRVDDEESP